MERSYRNVNDAFRGLVNVFACGDGNRHAPGHNIIRKPYSNPNGSGLRIQINEPVMIHYSHPKERVLFNGARDANPFFHLYESLWMLTGRNDVAPLAYYNSKVGGYSDDGKTFNGAYGCRWRQHLAHLEDSCTHGRYYTDEVDQLAVVIDHLRRKPESSRAVLAMWNVEDDLLKIDSSKDVCCLAGETMFRSPEGDTDITTLARRFQTEKGFRFPVYTVDTITGDQRLSWMTAAWRTGVRKTRKLILDDGSALRLTGDHRVFRKRKMFDGKRCIGISVSECLACDLEPGDSLLAEMPERASARTDPGGYRMFKRNIFHNTSWKNMIREHREYYEFVTGEAVGNDEIHHKDEHKLNNKFNNLEQLSSADHQRQHKMGEDNPHCQMSAEAKGRRGRIHSAVMQCGGKNNTPPHIREILNRRPPYRSDEQNEILWDWVCSTSNHKIVSIEDGGVTPVYDFTVPGRHNAVLSNGVVVHNCNLNVVFSLRELKVDDYSLDMAVFNRSNDLIWGALGANYVTFSILQEYVAAHLGVEVGRYTQATTNLHVYDWNWKPEEWLAERTQDAYLSIQQYNEKNPGTFNLVPLVKDPATFDRELPAFVERNGGKKETYSPCRWEEPFFNTVAQPMMTAFRAHKEKWGGGTGTWLTQIADDAWKIAATNWLKKRIK